MFPALEVNQSGSLTMVCPASTRSADQSAVRPQTKCCASAQSTRALLATARLPQHQRRLWLNKQQENAGDSASGVWNTAV
jgi:hypothetical protein